MQPRVVILWLASRCRARVATPFRSCPRSDIRVASYRDHVPTGSQARGHAEAGTPRHRGRGGPPGAPRSWPLQHSSSVLLASAHCQRRSRRRPSARLVQSRLSPAPRRPACARCLGPVTHLPRPSNCLLGTLAWRVPQLASSAGSSHSCPFSSHFVPIGEVRSSVSTPSQAYVAIAEQSPAHLAPIVTGA